jgi:uncharacterized protein involved in outer membrane biogenesis
MKKWIIRLAIAFIVLVVLAVLGIGFFLDSAIKKGVETVGPALTKVNVKLDEVSLSLLSGSGSIKGLEVGNPEGYKTPSAIKVGKASLALKAGSVLSDKVVIKSIDVQGPEITYETNLKQSNIGKILANLDEVTGGGTKQPASKEASPSKKLQVDDFRITGGKVSVSVTTLGGQAISVALPEIHLTGLGTGPDGISAADLTRMVLAAIEKSAAEVAASAVSDLGKQAAGLGKDAAGKAAQGAADAAVKNVGGLFKKK